MTFKVLTIFPDMLRPILGGSIWGGPSPGG